MNSKHSAKQQRHRKTKKQKHEKIKHRKTKTKWISRNADFSKPVLNKIMATQEQHIKYNFVAPLTIQTICLKISMGIPSSTGSLQW